MSAVTASEQRREHARAAGAALDYLLYGPRKRTDPRPGCRAAMAHLKDCGLWGELSLDVLAELVAEWQAEQ